MCLIFRADLGNAKSNVQVGGGIRPVLIHPVLWAPHLLQSRVWWEHFKLHIADCKILCQILEKLS